MKVDAAVDTVVRDMGGLDIMVLSELAYRIFKVIVANLTNS